MDLLPELCLLLIHYLSIDDLNHFRVGSKELCEYAKSYEGSPREFVSPCSLESCFRCYPKLKYLNPMIVSCKDFHYFANIEELSINTLCLTREDIFSPCIKLKKLYLSACYSDYTSLDDTFKHLTQITYLSLYNVYKITDLALNFAPQLKELHLSERCNITSYGIRSLKHLKKLLIDTPQNGHSSLVRDDAFEGSPIEELILHHHDYITDRGILRLKQLRTLICINVSGVQGEGWRNLTKLETVGIGNSTIYNISNFKFVKKLTFQDSRIYGTWSGVWLNLTKLRFYHTTLEFPGSIKNMTCPQIQKIRIIQCPQMNEHEESLCKTFGQKLIYKI